MQDRFIYEYAVIRVVPRVDREEFVNIGLILFCKNQKYLRIQKQVNTNKILAICTDFDINQLHKNLEALDIICKRSNYTGRLDDLDLGEKFRFITAVKSSVIQTSRPHPGYSSDLDKTFDRLFTDLVL